MNPEIARLGLGAANAYLLKTTGGFLLVDAGFASKRGVLDEALRKAGCVPGSLGLVVITHGDGDLFCGDTLGNMLQPDTAMNALDFATLDRSVERLLALDMRTVYPGHGKPFPMTAFRKRRRGRG